MSFSTSGISSIYSPVMYNRSLKPQTSAGQTFADALAIAADNSGGSTSENEPDTITLDGNRGTSPLLAKSAIILPTMNNIQILSSALKDQLGSFFRNHGISTRPPVEFTVNGEGRVSVTSDRADAAEIEDLINSNETLMESITTLNAISGIAYNLPRHLQFQAEYRASRNPEAVVAKYNDLFSPRPHTFSMRFGGEDGGGNLELLVDGKTWSQTNIDTAVWADQRIDDIIAEAEDTVADTISGLGE